VSASLRLRVILVAATVLFFSYFAAANLFSEATRLANPVIPDRGIRLGLDLRGGIHWVLGVKLDAATEHELEFQRTALVEELADEGVKLAGVTIADGHLRVETGDADVTHKVLEWAKDRGVLAPVGSPNGSIEFRLSDRWAKEVRDRGMQQVLEVVRRRIEDPIQGIPDSVVTRQGDDRILVQIPGGQIDRTRARDMLKVTGFLEFKIVQDSAQTEELLRAKHKSGLPPQTQIAFERDKETQRVLSAFLVGDHADVTGDYLQDARVAFDNRQRPIVTFQFNAQGGGIFEKLTSEHVGSQLAIVLDDRVYSAPVIRTRIGSRGQIEGRFTPAEAADLAVVLRSGSLSLPVTIEEERTVGPGLGADSIRAGARSTLVSFVAVLGFMLLYYRFSGVYSSIALVCNLAMMIGMMTLFGATLTLPGIAAFVLTIGMAVDANVLIFERIREELRAGKTPRGAIGAGFNKAFWAITDSNLTTIITALVLYEYGTGPVKGFAVALSIGIVTSVFAALAITRVLYDLWPGDRHIEKLSI
jgi:preprotein translocase subunit SecD